MLQKINFLSNTEDRVRLSDSGIIKWEGDSFNVSSSEGFIYKDDDTEDRVGLLMPLLRKWAARSLIDLD